MIYFHPLLGTIFFQDPLGKDVKITYIEAVVRNGLFWGGQAKIKVTGVIKKTDGVPDVCASPRKNISTANELEFSALDKIFWGR